MKYRDDVEYFMKGSQIIPLNKFDEQIFTHGESVYEVIRIHDKKTLFLNEHLERLQSSINLVYGDIHITIDIIKEDIFNLIRLNKVEEGNIKVELRKDQEQFIPYIYLIPHRYPSDNQYKEGVSMRFQFSERQFPNAKVSNWEVRGIANSLIDNHNIYETLLVNSKGYITEGSRSNIFLIKNNILYSAPEEWILSGITRAKVLDICKQEQIEVRNEEIHYNEISDFDACFITGTSPVILQINTIEKTTFALNHSIYKTIRSAFISLLQSE